MFDLGVRFWKIWGEWGSIVVRSGRNRRARGVEEGEGGGEMGDKGQEVGFHSPRPFSSTQPGAGESSHHARLSAI